LTPAPKTPFFDASGRALTLAELLENAEGLPLLLAFFKVGCPTCRLAWPYVQKLHALYGGTAVRVAGVCQDTAAEGAAFYREHGKATFDLLVDPEPRFAASNAFDVESVPHIVLLSPGAAVKKTVTGWSKREMEALGRELAEAKGLAKRPVVEPADPVKEWQAG
jgi:peroxiredoxin